MVPENKGENPAPKVGQGGACFQGTEEPSGRWLYHSPVARVHVDQKAGLTGKKLNTLEILVKYCPQVYFKLYYDIKVHHRLEDGPKHILTQLRWVRSQPKKDPTAVTFKVRTGAWFATQNVSSSR
ncbi:hypothetical protein GWK47_050060 [Chionoecetes opilio]|uniref:Uncharacterized protein n=1 Tax=Chionoecetes opilio TaxID=41210 RepID=A0A8J4Y2Y7_CHIOP|nr:hypothetical protein GWK47_050060 [Chionoecetes opilio]